MEYIISKLQETQVSGSLLSTLYSVFLCDSRNKLESQTIQKYWDKISLYFINMYGTMHVEKMDSRGYIITELR